MAHTIWSSTIWSTPEAWGDYTVYGDDGIMAETIASLIEAGGEEWADISLSDCTEYDLVQVVSDSKAIYQKSRARSGNYITVEHPEEPKVDHFDSLAEAIEYLS